MIPLRTDNMERWVMERISILYLAFVVSLGLSLQAAEQGGRHNMLARLGSECFEVTTHTGLSNLLQATTAAIENAKRNAQKRTERRERMQNETPLAEMSMAQLKEFLREAPGLASHKSRRGLEEIRQRAEAALATDDPELRMGLARDIAELACAVRNTERAPAPRQVELIQVPFMLWDFLHRKIGSAQPTVQGSPVPSGQPDDPDDSSFWKRPNSISSQNLFFGFSRSTALRPEEQIFSYRGPKTSFGTKAGFEIEWGGQVFKVKFGEPSEPFAARILSALGYNVESIDYAPRLAVRYERRLFREFNLRKPIDTDLRLLGVIPLWFVRLQRHYDPFDFIAAAVLKDGSRVSGAALKTMLLRDANGPRPEARPENFNLELEREVDYVFTVPASVQLKNPNIRSVGPWDFNELGHENRRELRGLGLLAAWLGWYDVRYDNNRLKLIRGSGYAELRHFFTDLGQSLGKADTGLRTRRPEAPNDFTWTFTRPPKAPGPGKMALPFRITNYAPLERTIPFEEMTLEDARWMARLIAQLTETQIQQALAASGYDAAHVRLYTEKLVSRRDQMIRDLGLADTFSVLRPEGVNREFSYDPERDGPLIINGTNQPRIRVRTGDSVVVLGRVTSRRERSTVSP